MANTEHTFAIQAALQDARNYNTWIADQFAARVGSRVLDIGSGYGNIISHFVAAQRYIIALDVESAYIDYLNSKYSSKTFQAINADFSVVPGEQLSGYKIDTITCFNVLEHFEDDIAVLQKMFSLLPKGGTLCLLVPAMPMLYGSMDKADGHYRRYTKKDLAGKLTRVGFEIEKLYFMNFPGVFGWFLNGRVLKRDVIRPTQVRFYDMIVPAIRACESVIHPPVGQSLVVIAHKK